MGHVLFVKDNNTTLSFVTIVNNISVKIEEKYIFVRLNNPVMTGIYSCNLIKYVTVTCKINTLSTS